MPAAAVIPAPEAYANVAVVERLAVELHGNSFVEEPRRCKLLCRSLVCKHYVRP